MIMMVLIIFQNGMGNLHLDQEGIHLDGISEFLLPLYVKQIQSRGVSNRSLLLISILKLRASPWLQMQKLILRL